MTPPALAPSPVAPPPPVRLAVALVYARIVLTVLGVVLSLVYRDEAMAVAGVAGGDAGLARTFAGIGFALGVVVALVTIALWVVLAVFTAKGHGWARIVLTVLAGLALLAALFSLGSVALTSAAGLPQVVPPALTALQTVVGLALWVVTVVLLWRPASSAFFAAAAAARTRRAASTRTREPQ